MARRNLKKTQDRNEDSNKKINGNRRGKFESCRNEKKINDVMMTPRSSGKKKAEKKRIDRKMKITQKNTITRLWENLKENSSEKVKENYVKVQSKNVRNQIEKIESRIGLKIPSNIDFELDPKSPKDRKE